MIYKFFLYLYNIFIDQLKYTYFFKYNCIDSLFFSLPNKLNTFVRLVKDSITSMISNIFAFNANWAIDKSTIRLFLHYWYNIESTIQDSYLFFLFIYLSYSNIL